MRGSTRIGSSRRRALPEPERPDSGIPADPSGAYQNRRGESGTPVVTPCGCGSGAVTVTYDGTLLDPDQVRTRLTLSDAQMSAAVNLAMGGSMSAELRKLSGRTRAQDRAEVRKLKRILKILRDTAVRKLRAQGKSVREIADYLYIGQGTVQRALAPGAVTRTNAARAFLKASGKGIPGAPISEIRDMLRDMHERRSV